MKEVDGLLLDDDGRVHGPAFSFSDGEPHDGPEGFNPSGWGVSFSTLLRNPELAKRLTSYSYVITSPIPFAKRDGWREEALATRVAIRLWRGGWSGTKISKFLRKSNTWVYDRVKNFPRGDKPLTAEEMLKILRLIGRPVPRIRKYRKHSEEEIERARLLHALKFSIYKIAKRMDVSTHLVWRWVNGKN
ncbi:hypothetical protein DRN43_00590 [Thermococci archaeon]|nr:MAG: hypothetical protein DRN43_00590 [Thermococci archaeon]